MGRDGQQHGPSQRRFKNRKQTGVARAAIEALESRQLLSVNVLTYHNDLASTGLNASETTISQSNVGVGSFGKWFATPLDGQVYAQPLVDTAVNITAGPNTVGSVGTHDIVLVATEHDSLYAVDATYGANGTILWKRDFTSLASNGSTPGTNINNTLNATVISSVPSFDVNTEDVTPEIGITGTPVIDGTQGIAYLVVKSRETIGGFSHYVQRLHAINLGNGTDYVIPYLIGDTTNKNVNNTSLYVYGNGDGAMVDPYNNTGKNVIQFNALREHQRGALSLVNGEVYVQWASHGDNGPYHGMVAKWNVASIASSGFTLSGVFNTTPNGGLAGIWMGGGRLAFESDGSAFYFETGNGPSGHATQTFNANGFPSDGNYYEALVKVVADPSTTATNQNINGWGFKAADFFIPYNQASLDNADQDFGSSGTMILPDSAGVAGHPHLMLASGKQGKIYVVDRDNMGKYNSVNDNVVNAVSQSGHNTPTVQLGGSLSTAAFYNGAIYWAGGYNAPAVRFTINPDGTLSATSQSVATLGYLPGSISISSNGNTGGIAWVTDRNANVIHAYDAATFSTELWNSGMKAGGADNLGAVVKFAVPTVANGAVYVGTSNSLVVYGLTPPATAKPNAPVLSATPLSGTSINLTWVDSTQNPNAPAGYAIEQLVNGNYVQTATAPGGTNSLQLGGLTPTTQYSFRIRGYNGLGYSDYSNIATATTSNAVAVFDYSQGFTGSTSKLKYNGSAAINGTRARLTTNGVRNQAGSVFSSTAVDVSKFQTQFTFQTSSGGTKADGFTFTIQGVGPAALGSIGGGLGYGTDGTATGPVIGSSVAIKFDLFSNKGEGKNSTGIFTNGASPTKPAIDLTSSGINLQTTDIFQVTMVYDGSTLAVTILDTITGATATQNYTVNIPGVVGGTTAYVGFTGADGGSTSTQDILSWTYTPSTPQSPADPSALGATIASATSITLNWTNNATNQTGFVLDRATDVNFLNNLVTQTLPATPNSFTDTYTGLAPGSTFYYRLRATNSAGGSGYSNVTLAYIPLAPNKPSDAVVTAVTSSTIDLSWTDNAGRSADGYRILRSMDFGTFDVYAILPALNATPPASYTWQDTSVSAGHYYEYHIVAYNVSGYNDFAGTNATALPAAPTSPVATPANGSVGLTWGGSFGALSYNVYRGTSGGGEGATPLASGLTATSYTDSAVTNGTTYYYFVTAVVGNTPPLPSEGDHSAEVNATPAGSVQLVSYNVNFTYSTGDVVPNYIKDTGATWGAHSGGLAYGWNVNNAAQMRDRDSGKSPDELHDSFAHMQKTGNPNAWWGIAVPNGTYSVRVIMGDPTAYDSIYKLNVSDGTYTNGTLTTFSPVLAIDGTPNGTKLWYEATITVTVTHGGIFVTNATGSKNNKIDAVQITQQS